MLSFLEFIFSFLPTNVKDGAEWRENALLMVGLCLLVPLLIWIFV